MSESSFTNLRRDTNERDVPTTRSFAGLAEPTAANGYAVIPIRQRTKIPEVSGWPTWQIEPQTPGLLDNWAEEFGQSGLGLVLGWNGLMAFDIDVHDQSMVNEIVDQIEDLCGRSPLKRVGNAPKIALFYRFEGQQPGNGRQAISLGELGQVEVFTSGRQMVAFNTHPDTGRPYEWIGSGDPTSVSVFDLPPVDHDLFRTVIQSLSMNFAGEGAECLLSQSEEPTAQYVRDPSSGLVIENRDGFLSALCFAEMRQEFVRSGSLAGLHVRAEHIAQTAFVGFEANVHTIANRKGTGLPWTRQHAIAKVHQKLKRAAAVGPDQFFGLGADTVASWSSPDQSLISCEDAEAVLEECFNDLVERAVASNQQRVRWEESLSAQFDADSNSNIFRPPPIAQQSLVKVTTGVGKSTAARKAIRDFVQAMRAADGDRSDRTQSQRDYGRVLFLCARHDTAAEQRAEFDREFGQRISSTVWYGRGAKHPGGDLPEGWQGDRMCDDEQSSFVSEVGQKGGSIQQLVCSKCRFADRCPYLLQQDTTDQYDVVFASHEFLQLGPHEAMGEFGLVVVDEWPGSVASIDQGAKSILVDQLGSKFGVSQWPVLKGKVAEAAIYFDANATRELERIELALKSWIKQTASPVLSATNETESLPIRLDANQLHIELSDVQKAIWWEQKRLICRKVECSSLNALRSILRRLPPRDEIEARIALLQFVLYSKSQRPFHLEHFGIMGASVRLQECGDLVVDVHRHGTISGKVLFTPTVFLDATADAELLTPIAPFLMTVADLKVEAPHQHLVLHKFRTTQQRMKNEAYLAEIVERINDRSDGKEDCAAIVPKSVRSYFETALPHFSIYHHGAVSGLNNLSSSQYLAVVGSQRMPEEAACEIARDNFDELSERGRVSKKYKQWDRQGGASLVEYRGHLSELADRIVTHTEQASLVQAIGRARGVRRDADNPVLIDVFAVPPLPLQDVTAVMEGPTLAGTASAELRLLDLADRVGIVPLSPAAAVSVFPGHWGNGSPKSQEQCVTRSVSRACARSQREADGCIATWFAKMRSSARWVEVKMRMPGARGPASKWLVDKCRHPSPEQAIAALFAGSIGD